MEPMEFDQVLEAAIIEALKLTLEGASPPVTHVLKYFEFAHLPPKLRSTSMLFADLACRIATGPQNPETTVALRKLLESKDAAVRALL